MLKNKINLFNTLNGRILFLIILSTITLQIIYFITFQNKYGELGYTTESYYQDTAINLITFKSYSQGDPPVNTAYRPPLYPFTLAGVYTIFGKYPQLAIILNNLFIIISLFTTYLIGKKISPSIGLISAILFALDPVIFVNANRISAGSQYCMLISLFVIITINNFDRNITLKNTRSTMSKKKEPWFHIKDVLKGSTKEIVSGFEEISLMLIGKKKKKKK